MAEFGDFEIDLSPLIHAIEQAERRYPGAVRDELEDCVNDAAESAKATATFQDRTGTLRSEISSEVTGDIRSDTLEGRVFAPTPYAIYIEDGTAPRDITARVGTVLRFVFKGNVMYRRRIHHPGIKARHFLRDSVDPNRISERIEQRIVDVLCGK